ncbi:protein phosphatase 2C [Lineolata rhizophorae]|uniref:Protein phosphatase 2C n=1 Tax=Lineolata rhizophorae TaxID=578093 RepID=A0A6A6PCQ0_9PEZI|nr:protein phosphatase 2C [Lineolata rhizophorae]
MRRAALQLRSLRPQVHRLARVRQPGHARRALSTHPMHLRRFSVALVSTVVASGAYYAYRGAESPASSPAVQTRSLTSPSAEATASRRAIVVEQGQVYMGSIPDNEPLSKETDTQGRRVLEMLTPEQATRKLRKNEESWLVGRGKGVVRYDVVQIPSNDPIEDDHAEKIIEVPQTVAATEGGPNSDWMFWGVFDGHSGWTTSAKLRQVLISFVARELNATYQSALTNPALTIPTPESVDAAIKKGFLRLDHEIVHEAVNKVNKAQSKSAAAELLAPALSGSCALLSFYDSRSKLLRVACTGDSRAVLGRRGGSGKWTATPLSVDQTGASETEAERLRAEHPGEPNVVANGRVLGRLEPTRAFGDAVYKWSVETQERIAASYFGRSGGKLMQTPPYVTAEPVVTTTKVEPQNGDFLVMATDGLWEMLTNEEVVGLVGRWLEEQARREGAASAGGSWLGSWFSSAKAGLPVESPVADKDASGQRSPIRRQQWGLPDDQTGRFVVEDENAATHLVRNALGGKDSDQLCALLTLQYPTSRRFRDDLTVEVVFFGDSGGDGNVSVNQRASASADGLKAKL